MQSMIAYISIAIAVASAATIKQEGKAETIRYVQAFIDFNTQGPYEDFFDYAPDLSLAGINNAIKSACYTGFWIAYDEVNYGPDGGLSCSDAGISKCEFAIGNCSGVASSLRYAGNPDGLNEDYYNLYAGSYFTGDEFRNNNSAITVGDLDERVSSIIISGTAQWTFFTLPSFGGTGVCVTPDFELTDNQGTVLNYGYVYEVTDLGLPDNSIRSVVKGCLPHARVVGSSRRVAPNHLVGQAPAV